MLKLDNGEYIRYYITDFKELTEETWAYAEEYDIILLANIKIEE